MIKHLKHIALGVLMSMGVSAKAQQEFTLYHMNNVFQSSYVNPVGIPEHGISISLPGISSTYLGVANTGFTFKSVFNGDSLDIIKVVDDLKKVNYITFGASYDLFALRFKVHNYNISLSIRDVLDFRFAYPQDLMYLLTEGNGRFIGQEANFNRLRVHANYYRDIGLGFGYHDPHSKWVFGGRFRFLFGMANITTAKSKTTFTTDSDTYGIDAESQIRVNTSGIANLLEDNADIDENTAIDYLTNFKNFGLGLDAGVSYKLNKKFTASFSVKDLGFIRWKTNPKNYETDGSFEFDGLELQDYSTTDTLLYFVENLPDSLEAIFDINESEKAYVSALTAQTYLNMDYYLTKHTRVAGTLFAEFFHGIQPGVFASITQDFGRGFDLTLSYSGFRNSWNNLGFGFSVKPGPIQFYLVSDNILGPLVWGKVDGVTVPYSLKSTNLRFGINILVGKVREPELQSLPKL